MIRGSICIILKMHVHVRFLQNNFNSCFWTRVKVTGHKKGQGQKIINISADLKIKFYKLLLSQKNNLGIITWNIAEK